MAIARVFKSGNSQTVRLPKKFHVKSKELEIAKGAGMKSSCAKSPLEWNERFIF
jgi:antitoxin component of MazEF toxin-antitoxin module